MRNLLTIALILLLSTSFQISNTSTQPKLLGTLELYLTSDNQVVLYYHGVYPYCYMKYATDILFIECDTMGIVKCGFDTTFQDLHIIPLDTIELIKDRKIEIKRI